MPVLSANCRELASTGLNWRDWLGWGAAIAARRGDGGRGAGSAFIKRFNRWWALRGARGDAVLERVQASTADEQSQVKKKLFFWSGLLRIGPDWSELLRIGPATRGSSVIQRNLPLSTVIHRYLGGRGALVWVGSQIGNFKFQKLFLVPIAPHRSR